MRILPLFTLVAGCTANAFACEDAGDCAGVMGGVCESTGWCSFPDDTCDSGRRYGEWAGNELAGACVDDVGTGSSGSTDDGASATSPDPTTLSTTDPDTTLGGDTTMSIDPDTTTSIDPTVPGDDSSTTGSPFDPDLVAWYRFEEGGLAGTVVDEVGTHDGTCLLDRCPQSIPGVMGSAAAFDGVDDIVHVPVADMLPLDEGLTVATWMRVDTIDGMFQTVIAKAYLDLIADTFEIGINASGVLRWGHSTVVDEPNVNADPPPVGEWIHLAGTFDADASRFYVNGVLAGETMGGVLVQDEHDVTLGAGFDNTADANWLEGALDEVRIYRRALTEDEIAALASR